MQALFDCYVVVDWSASATPKTGVDSIWSCVFDPSTAKHHVVNHRTRLAARDFLCALLIRTHGRVLIGFDFPYGYPTGFADAAQLTDTPPWSAVWDFLQTNIVDAVDNTNNRFEVAAALNRTISDGHGPFWATTSDRHVTEHLSRTKAPGFPHGALAEFRTHEAALRAVGRYPSSVWQLSGAGSVGSQALTGIPVVQFLRRHPALRQRSVVWPFETGLVTDPTGGRTDAIVHAEMWPSAIPLDRGLHEVKDSAQVIGLCRHLAALDAAGGLAAQFCPPLDDDTARVVAREEGWIVAADQGQRAGRRPV